MPSRLSTPPHFLPQMESDGLPSVDVLRSAYQLEVVDGQVTGRLFHKSRPVEWFSTQMACDLWNAKWSGREAMTSIHESGYRFGSLFRGNAKAHRVLWKMLYGGLCPEEIDHKNGIPHDNWPDNLKASDRLRNSWNQKKRATNTSGVNGVRWNKDRNRWSARIMIEYREKHLGYFKTKEDAAKARREADKKYGFSERHGT